MILSLEGCKSTSSLFPTTKDTSTCAGGKFTDKQYKSHLSSLIPIMVKKVKKTKKRKFEEAAPLYTEDLGTLGIKKSSPSNFVGYQKSISELPLPKDEDERRQKRMVRL